MLKAGQKYRHYKGNEYEILCLAIDHDTDKLLVIYQDTHNVSKILARSVEDFTSPVKIDGIEKARYVQL